MYKDEREREYVEGLTDEEIEQLMREALFDLTVGIEVCDGCVVEPDGQCPHGYTSPLKFFGFM